MKKLLIGMFAVAAFIFTANAQEQGKIENPKLHQGKAMMLKGLNFSAAQKEQMKTTRESTRNQLAELNKDEDITVREYKARKAAILKAQKEQMARVLTEEQKKQLKQNKIDRKARHELAMDKRLDKMKARLNLSDEQVTKMKANREANRQKLISIRENDQLSKIEKKEQLFELKQEQKNSFRQLLTPEQIIKMEELKKERKEKSGRK